MSGTPAPAQAPRVLLGLKGGAHIARGIGADAAESTSRFGGHGGALVRLRVYKQFGLQVEGLYMPRGDNSQTLNSNAAIGHQLAYISVPVLAQYHYHDVFFEAGPQFGRLLAAKPANVQYPGVTDYLFRKNDIGFSVGFGYQDTTGILLGWRYTGGLQNIYRRVDWGGSSQAQLRNSSIEFYLGYLFEPQKVVRLGVSSAKLVFIRTPALLFKGGKFLFYTAPGKLLRRSRSEE
ncbi:hypothetical protein HNQ93_003276 [Hymenobacter luteus]|uniref:Outer membrane protein beta-barrel domain-containing protein n=2 Tax=Hymenobacter TaxID=89966 RepID=A0A7W9WDC3_9BACT|nr:hypothetical protein [Hymenobacter latericoloratus]MBB6060410.1 hypothetical protein [Hymenobacter luteus]